MSANKYQPHVLVLPEDDANRQLANGFILDPTLMNRRIHVLTEAGGWNQVLQQFKSKYAATMGKYPFRFMVLLIDSDDDMGRIGNAKAEIPEHLRERVFIIGVRSRPEALKQAILGSYEKIGLALAKDRRDNTDVTWNHELLQHNGGEIDRLRRRVRSILFPAN